MIIPAQPNWFAVYHTGPNAYTLARVVAWDIQRAYGIVALPDRPSLMDADKSGLVGYRQIDDGEVLHNIEESEEIQMEVALSQRKTKSHENTTIHGVDNPDGSNRGKDNHQNNNPNEPTRQEASNNDSSDPSKLPWDSLGHGRGGL